MMRARDVKLAVLAVACTAAVGLATTYQWIGQGEDDNWDTCDNWAMTGMGEECYPSTEADDGWIPYTEGGWTVNLINVGPIDDLTVAGSVRFEALQPSTPVTLEVDSLTIVGHATEGSVVVFDDLASIVTAED